MSRPQLFWMVCFFVFDGVALAHGNVDARVHSLDHRIAAQPKNVGLRLTRGSLLLDEGHAAAALADFRLARRYAPGNPDSWYGLARANLQLGRTDAARSAVHRFIAAVDSEAAKARGYQLDGDILLASGQPLAAGEAYRDAAERTHPPIPDLLLFSAKAFAEAKQTERAIGVLDSGIAQLGPLHSLLDAAADFELGLGRYEAALGRIERMLAADRRQPFLLYRKGVLLKHLGRGGEARQAFSTAQQALADWPPTRHSPALDKLKADLAAAVQ